MILALLLAAVSACPHHHSGDLVVATPEDIPACLETVDGHLIVGTDHAELHFPHLTDVTGRVGLTLSRSGRARFPRLERVHGGLEAELHGHAELDLPRLEQVGGPIGLDFDPETGGAGLAGIHRHTAGLWIFGGGDLTGLLPRLTEVSGTVFVQPTGPVRGVLPGIRRVGGHLVISNASHLPVEGLAELERVDGGLYLFGGREIALPRLKVVGEALAVRDTQLRSLAAVGGEGSAVGALLLSDNPDLATWPSHLEVAPNRIRVDGSPSLRGTGRTQKARTRKETAKRRSSASSPEATGSMR